jgi:hypothetical protein
MWISLAFTCCAICFIVSRSETRGTLSYNVSAVISHVKHVLYFYIITFRSSFVQWQIRLFFLQLINSVLSWYVARVLYERFEMVPVTPIITDFTSAFTFHMRWISVMRSLYVYFKIFSAPFLTTFLYQGIATAINMHVLCLLSRIIMSGLLLGIVLLVVGSIIW